MQRCFIAGVIMVAFFVLMPVTQANAFHCPVMIKENQALIDKAEKTALSTSAKDQIEKAEQLNEEAQKLHESGDHAQAMIKAHQAATTLADAALAAVK